ncbi:MAG: hypothetical protein F9K40_15095 [Kofleriaceae bacterium]|nr:MAG: hypothetical protein F9K40_15095 [Kofleriaceae bacterium]MBZ0235641.1 hypothetical protein [Kofleriaceae bacterium]
MSDERRAERARARRQWPVVRGRVDDQTSELLLDVPPARRVAMVWALTVDAWALRGEAIPDYARGEAPGRVVRPGER